MTHQTGITTSATLREFLNTALTFSIRKIRLIKMIISEEELVLSKYKEASGTWDEDYNATVLSVVKEHEPCFIFYRLDSQNEFGFEWLFIPFAPDEAEVRKKMLHAATRNNAKMEFGSGRIKEELFGTVVSDINLEGYRKHVAARSAGPALTSAEEELAAVKQMHHEVVEAAARAKTKHLPGIAFPVEEGALNDLQRIIDKQLSHVQLAIDGTNEKIYLVRSGDIQANEFINALPSDFPTYNFFLFRHTHDSELLESIVFISSMPSESCTIREKMLYSSCKGPLLQCVREQLGMEIAKKIDVTEDDEVNGLDVFTYIIIILISFKRVLPTLQSITLPQRIYQ